MYNKQIELVGSISEPGQKRSYRDMLDEENVPYTILNSDRFLEISPRQYQIITPEMDQHVKEDMTVVTGSYQGNNRQLYFVEISINLGKEVINHTTLIYDTEPSVADMAKIMDNYQNLIIHVSSNEVYR